MSQTADDQRTHRFNPQDHVIQLKSKSGSADYLPVQWRLVWFREECPNGTIDTEEIEVDLDREMEEEVYAWNNETRRSEKVMKRAKGYARYKATVTDGKGGKATGTKSEKAVSFPDFIEKAECVPLDSEILTRRGFKHYDEIEVGEDVLAYDHLHDQCVWTPLQRVVIYQNAPVSRLHGEHFDVLCTPDHSWATYYKAMPGDRIYEYRALTKAYKLRKQHRIVLAAPGPDGTHPLTPRDAAILGWLITDGSIQMKDNCTRSYICQSKQENVPIIRELVGTLARETVHAVPTRTFPTGKTYDCLPQHRFTFSAEETRRIFNVAGITCIEDLPGMVTQYTSEARKAMLASMMLADGDKRNYFGKKRKPGVMEAWQILATLEGFALGQIIMSTVGEVPLQKMKKRRMADASELHLESIGKMDVWCPTTQLGTWVMRQNGRVMITGNTGAIGRALAALGYGTQFAPEMDEGSRLADAPVDRTPENNNRKPLASVRPATSHQDGQGTGEVVKPSIHSQPPQSQPQATQEQSSGATEQQLSSIRKLLQHLSKPEPEDLDIVTYLAAKELISQLSLEYRQSRKSA